MTSSIQRILALSALAILSACLVLSAVGQDTATATSAAATSAAATIDAFHAALGRGDREAVLAVLAPEVVIFEAGGAEMDRDEYAAHHLAGDMEFSAAVETEIVDRRSDARDGVAWVLSRTTTHGTFGGRTIDSTGTETMVLDRRADGWRIVHIHWSSRAKR